jgi:hypothetical protein
MYWVLKSVVARTDEPSIFTVTVLWSQLCDGLVKLVNEMDSVGTPFTQVNVTFS